MIDDFTAIERQAWQDFYWHARNQLGYDRRDAEDYADRELRIASAQRRIAPEPEED